MTNTIELLKEIESKSIYDKQDIITVAKSVSHQDPYARGMAASLLVNFNNKKALNLLLQLTKDVDEIVRAEAYDSLSVFGTPKIERILKKAILYEKGDFACFYAILSWVAIVKENHLNMSKHYRFICNLQNKKKIKKSEYCILACSCGKCLFSEKEKINIILDFFESQDYLVRCVTVTVLGLIAEYRDTLEIKNNIENFLENEDNQAVQACMTEEINYLTNLL